jgi:hypothetical protein
VKSVVKWLGAFGLVCAAAFSAHGQSPGAARVTPNLVDNIDRPLRYRPDGPDFVIENGAEFFNRPLYGGNTAFRVDGGDRPEFVLYLPGRGGNLRLGFRVAGGAPKWLHEARTIGARYRPGELRYEIADPLLGSETVLRVEVVAYAETEGLGVRVEAAPLAAPARGAPKLALPAGLELLWAYGGVNGQRGKRDGDIGTENVPISQWFQLQPEFCRDNAIELGAEKNPAGAAAGGAPTFTLRAKAATIFGVMPAGAQLAHGDAANWQRPAELFAALAAGAASGAAAPALPLVIGRAALRAGEPLFLSLQRIDPAAAAGTGAAATEDLAVYREVTAKSEKAGPATGAAAGRGAAANTPRLAAPLAAAAVPRVFEATQRHFAALRTRVSVDTPDPFLNAAVGALNVAADAVWDEPQQAIMHGAIAWRTRLLGWRGPYALTALGWPERARKHFEYWATRQNTAPIPEKLPPADENANLARNETALHSNGDMSNSHYDMNLVYIDALFRHLRWTGDLELAKKLWPVIERHLAWERRLFRREFDAGGGHKLPLYEAYAAIWASDDLQYHGGGTMHATAYNYFHNREAARLARLIGVDPDLYQHEAQLLELGMRALLWVPHGGAIGDGHFGEFKDLLGLQRVHAAAALWTFYHTMDSEVPTPQEAWAISRQVDAEIPHLPVRGAGVPEGFYTLGTSNWLPYDWSINNVVMAEAVHGALGFWQAGRPEEAWRIAKGSLLAAMFMGISPGNVGSMSYLDVYRRESQRDFADGSGVLSRALVEGLFGLQPDAIGGELRVTPGWPAEWKRAALEHPDFAVRFARESYTDSYTIEQRGAKPLALRLRLKPPYDEIESVRINGAEAKWLAVENAVGAPRIDLVAPAAATWRVTVRWRGITAPSQRPEAKENETFVKVEQGQMRWWQPIDRPWFRAAVENGAGAAPLELRGNPLEAVDLAAQFNDRVTQIFKNDYRAPRSPFVSLALPKQGLGGWAGGVNAAAEIDDSGLRALAAKTGGRLMLPSGAWFETPSEPGVKNVVFTSQWENYPRAADVPLRGRARGVLLLLAGSTNHMQSRFENGEVVVTYADNSTARLALENPTNWWPIEEDYFFDDFQFRIDATTRLPTRVNLKTGEVRVLELAAFKGRGGKIPGGAATVLELPLDPEKELRSLTVRALANEVVVGLMAATLVR